MGTRLQLVVVSGLSMGIPLMVGFRPQLVVVSGFSVGILLTVGFRPQLVVSGLSVGIPLTVGFRLSWSLRLSQSPFTKFSFTRCNFGYHGAFSWTFLSHDGISAITEPFTIFSFTRWNFGYHRAFHEFFFHTMEFWLSQSLSRIFLSHDGIHKTHDLGEDSFHIYHKEYLHRIRLVKNLASGFRAPFARKRVRSSLFDGNCKESKCFYSWNHL
jgi:hypothetical protein